MKQDNRRDTMRYAGFDLIDTPKASQKTRQLSKIEIR